MAFTNFQNGVTSFGIPLFGSGPIWNPYGSVLFVDGNLGNDGFDATSPENAVKTMQRAFNLAGSGDTIVFKGNITEQLVSPAGVFDVTIVGAGNKPRHADAHTGNNGFSASTWKPPSSPVAATALLRIQQQGWRLLNILFDAPSDAAAVQIFRDGGAGDAERDGSHAYIFGCRFDAGSVGINFNGGPAFVRLENNLFRGCTTALSNTVGAGIGTNLCFEILNNRFIDSTSHIVVPLNQGLVVGNVFGKFTATTGFGLDLSGGVGGNNEVHGNYLSGDYDGDYVAATGDEWAGNYSMDTGSAEVGAEGLTTAVPVA